MAERTIISSPYLEWGPILAGAVAAAAISFLLLTFGGAIGLTMTSPWPHSGVSAASVAIVVALWSVFVQVTAFAIGGYIAGRTRTQWMEGTVEERQFRDGTHGFIVWAVGVTIGALLLGLTGLSTLKTATQSAAVIGAGATGGLAANQNLATSPTDYATDIILRPAPASSGAAPGGTAQPRAEDNRAEVSRVFTSAIKNQRLEARDRDYLTVVVMNRTGLPQPEAEKRVDAAVEEAKTLEIKTRDAADKARKAALIAGFLAAASLLISAAGAAAGASLGGRHRDENRSPLFLGKRFW